jgi:hypothetical protein
MNGTTFDDSVGLSEVIADNSDTLACLVRTMYRYATAHTETLGESQVLRELGVALEGSGLRVRRLMRAVALSVGFRRLAPPSAQTIPQAQVGP